MAKVLGFEIVESEKTEEVPILQFRLIINPYNRPALQVRKKGESQWHWLFTVHEDGSAYRAILPNELGLQTEVNGHIKLKD